MLNSGPLPSLLSSAMAQMEPQFNSQQVGLRGTVQKSGAGIAADSVALVDALKLQALATLSMLKQTGNGQVFPQIQEPGLAL